MRDILVNNLITDAVIISTEEYAELTQKYVIYEYILYSDNILEGITLLNYISQNPTEISLFRVVYQPNSQPIYIFSHNNSKTLFAIKICGAFDKWRLPEEVGKIVDFIDLPDYIFYSITGKRVILAGENTETASVGNSQWQREGRKIGAALRGVPFIYQTFYSGKDESQGAIREPNSLQVYNQILYTVRYKTPSFIAYFENNFDGAKTRQREPIDATNLFCRYIEAVIVNDALQTKGSLVAIYDLEEQFLQHMLSYLAEGKFGRKGVDKTPRLSKDFQIINNSVYQAIISNSQTLSTDIVAYIHGLMDKEKFFTKYPFDSINTERLVYWSGYNDKQYIQEFIGHLRQNNQSIKSYKKGVSKIGIAPTIAVLNFFKDKFPEKSALFTEKLNPELYSEVIIMPLRVHKKSNNSLMFSPDPESGEIVAFAELFGKNCVGQKIRPIVGYVIVETPQNFNFESEKGTKLYKAVGRYIDLLIFDNKTIYTDFETSEYQSDFVPQSIHDVTPLSNTEEMAVVSTYLNLSTISSDWKLCFIHTHHSSWQQMVVHKEDGAEIQHKIDRKSTKVDLVMQNNQVVFMFAEGKNNYLDIIRDKKIRKALKNTSALIDTMYQSPNFKFDTFIYNLSSVEGKDPDYYAEKECQTISDAINSGRFNNIAYNKNFAIVIVYHKANKTAFRIVYSPDFDNILKSQLDRLFHQ